MSVGTEPTLDSNYAAVTADIVLTTVKLYDQRFELASYE